MCSFLNIRKSTAVYEPRGHRYRLALFHTLVYSLITNDRAIKESNVFMRLISPDAETILRDFLLWELRWWRGVSALQAEWKRTLSFRTWLVWISLYQGYCTTLDFVIVDFILVVSRLEATIHQHIHVFKFQIQRFRTWKLLEAFKCERLLFQF